MVAGKRKQKKVKKSRSRAALTSGNIKPPPEVRVPSAPDGWVPPNAADYRGFRPKRTELAVVVDAVLELAAFREYSAVFGMTAPPADQLGAALDTSSKWSALLASSMHWADFVRANEGMAWKDTLGLMDRLKMPFSLATLHDPTIAAKFPALARLLGAQKAIAKRSVATRKVNAVAKAKKAQEDAVKAASASVPAPTKAAEPTGPQSIVAVNVPMSNGRSNGAAAN